MLVLCPLRVSECNNAKCEEVLHKRELQEFADFLVDACITASECIPRSAAQTKKKRIPGWKLIVKPFLDKALFWHKLWVENDRPQHGAVADVRRHTRKQYHKAVKRAQRSETQLRFSNMAESYENGKKEDFWTQVKKMSGKGSTVPSNIDNVTEEKEIGELFASKYCQLFNSVSYDRGEMQRTMERNNRRIDIHEQDACTAHSFTPQDVSAAIKKLKRNKKDGNKGLYTDHLINAPAILNQHLAKLYTGMLSHGVCPEEFSSALLVPIPKNMRRSLNDSDNYRSIALSSILSKILDKVILAKCKAALKTSDHQFGFKERHSTHQCSFIVNEVITEYLRQGSSMYICLLDASKAFDRLAYVQLFSELSKRHLCPFVMRLTLNMYLGQQTSVRWGTTQSAPFSVSNGVKQGGVLSPTLFSVYLDELLSRIKNSGAGCHIGLESFAAFAYADDVVLLSPSLCGLKRLLTICAEYAREYNVLFNASKSKMIVLGNEHQRRDHSVTFMGGVIEEVDVEKHLGIALGVVSQRDRVESLCREMTVKTNMIVSHFKLLPPEITYMLFKSHAMPLYGSQLIDLSGSDVDRLYTAWRKCIRHLLRLPRRTHCALLPKVCCDVAPQVQLNRRFHNFFRSLYTSSNPLTKTCAMLALDGSRSSVSGSLSQLSCMSGVSRQELAKLTRVNLNVVPDDDDGVSSVIRDLLCSRYVLQLYGEDSCILSVNDVQFAIETLCTE